MLSNWLKIAFINYKKNGLSTLVNLFGLTVGLTGFMLIMMYWNDENSYESENPDKNRIYLVENSMGDNMVWTGATYPQMRVPKEQISGIEDFTLFSNYYGDVTLKYGNKKVEAKLFDATPNFFSLFHFKSISGNLNNAFNTTDKITLSDKKSRELFGTDDQSVIGKSVSYSGKNYIVSAVYQLPEGKSVINPDVVIENPYYKGGFESWGDYNYTGMFKFKENADIPAIKQKIDKILYHYRVEMPAKEEGLTPKEYIAQGGGGGTDVVLTPMATMKFDAKGSGIDKADKKTIYILMALSVLIVILSAINFINLKTAQASQRAKEVGVRKVLGSGRFQLVCQFLIEAFLVCLLAYVLSLACSEILLPSFNQFINKDLKMDDWHIYYYSAMMIILVVLISGLIPAFYLSAFKPIKTLKGNFAQTNQGIWLRNGILTLQLVISAFFITAGLIIYNQVQYMMNKDLGFDGNQSVIIPFNQNREKPYLFYELMKQQLTSIQGVKEVTYSKQIIGGGSSGSSNVDYKQEKKSIIANHGSIDLNFFKFYKIKMVAGRDFNPALSSDTINSAIVNETFVKKMGWTPQQALNKDVRPGFDQKDYKIIGVAKNYNSQGVANDIEPVLFFYYGLNWNKNQINNLQVKLDKSDIDGTLSRIKTFWETKAEPGFSFRSEFINKRFAHTFDVYKKQQTLFTILNALVLVVALLGLFALSSLLIRQKLKDVAIKRTLGADEKTIVWDLTKSFLLIATVAVFLSFPISYYLMNEWLKDFAYRIDMPIFPFVLSLILLLILTFAVVSIKAYQATKVNLVKYLKYE